MTSEAVAPVADLVGNPRRWLIVLDFDGTLSPIVDEPGDAALAPGAQQAITRLARTTTVAVLSGRHVDDLAPRLEGIPLILLGGHGTEVSHPDGTRESFLDLDERTPVLDGLENRLRTELDASVGWIVERKPASIAVHHRQVPREQIDRLAHVREVLNGAEGDWELLDGKAVTELRPAGIDKGTAVGWLADRHPGLDLLVVGDDVTDEDAFRAAKERGGTAVLVGSPERETAADHRLRDPSDVVSLIEALNARAAADR